MIPSVSINSVYVAWLPLSVNSKTVFLRVSSFNILYSEAILELIKNTAEVADFRVS
jgi:hypothetical protein